MKLFITRKQQSEHLLIALIFLLPPCPLQATHSSGKRIVGIPADLGWTSVLQLSGHFVTDLDSRAF